MSVHGRHSGNATTVFIASLFEAPVLGADRARSDPNEHDRTCHSLRDNEDTSRDDAANQTDPH
jgi:hypothetical protein